MPTELEQSARESILTFLQSRSESDVAADILRVIRDQSNLLYERQGIMDMLDSDPFHIMICHPDDDDTDVDDVAEEKSDVHYDENVAKEIERVKTMINVISCHRVTTRDGHSTIDAVVEFKNDSKMHKCVRDNVRLTFSFERRPLSTAIGVMNSNPDDYLGDVPTRDVVVASTAGTEDEMMIDEEYDGCSSKEEKKDDVITDKSDGNVRRGVICEESLYMVKSERKKQPMRSDLANASGTSIGTRELEHKCGFGGTRVSYTIDLSRDYGKKERLLAVEVMASGEGPSTERAVPMFHDDMDVEDEEWEDYDSENGIDDGEECAQNKKVSNGMDGKSQEGPLQGIIGEQSSQESTAFQTDMTVTDGRDRFGACVDPDILCNFLKWTRLKFDDSTLIFFLLTFPFYEHEWDLVGFVLDTVFGGYNDEENGELSIKENCDI